MPKAKDTERTSEKYFYKTIVFIEFSKLEEKRYCRIVYYNFGKDQISS